MTAQSRTRCLQNLHTSQQNVLSHIPIFWRLSLASSDAPSRSSVTLFCLMCVSGPCRPLRFGRSSDTDVVLNARAAPPAPSRVGATRCCPIPRGSTRPPAFCSLSRRALLLGAVRRDAVHDAWVLGGRATGIRHATSGSCASLAMRALSQQRRIHRRCGRCASTARYCGGAQAKQQPHAAGREAAVLL